MTAVTLDFTICCDLLFKHYCLAVAGYCAGSNSAEIRTSNSMTNATLTDEPIVSSAGTDRATGAGWLVGLTFTIAGER